MEGMQGVDLAKLWVAQNWIALCGTKTAVESLIRKGHRIYLPS